MDISAPDKEYLNIAHSKEQEGNALMDTGRESLNKSNSIDE